MPDIASDVVIIARTVVGRRNSKIAIIGKGVQVSECVTGRRLVSPAVGRKKNFWNPLYILLKVSIYVR